MDAYLEELRARIRSCEERLIFYKKQLEWVHRDRETWPPEDPFVVSYKDYLRQCKNGEESWLAQLREERTYYPGMTPSQFNAWVERDRRARAISDFRKALEAAYKNPDLSQFDDEIRSMLEQL